tara:strand:- start:6390 stop:6566 length:177 start_codon:yes stop_codon:yes gene_type:complete
MLFRIILQKSGHIGTGSALEGAENPNFILTSLGFVVTSKRLVDVALEVDADVRTNAIL